MSIRNALQWWSRPLFLRRKRPRATTLFAGPWVGEFGWELMCWQGFVRKLSRRYERVIVCCRAGHEPLYADFATGFVPHHLDGEANREVMERIANPRELSRVLSLVPSGADVLRPRGAYPMSEQEFVRYGHQRTDLRHDVVFHARGRVHGPHRNWGRDRWNELLRRLVDDGLSVGGVGLTRQTVSPDEGYTDHREVSLSTTLDVLASAQLVIGPSSGPMHLAALCGAPHVVWTDRQRYRRGPRSRDRYERAWNPLGTWTRVLDEDGFDPSVDTMYRAICEALTALRDRTVTM